MTRITVAKITMVSLMISSSKIIYFSKLEALARALNSEKLAPKTKKREVPGTIPIQANKKSPKSITEIPAVKLIKFIGTNGTMWISVIVEKLVSI